MRSASAGLVSCLLRQRGGGHRPQALVSHQPKRDLNLLEYQAKGLLQKYNVTVQDFRVAATADEAAKITSAFPCKEYVIKAQVLAGGRGKGHFDNGFKVRGLLLLPTCWSFCSHDKLAIWTRVIHWYF